MVFLTGHGDVPASVRAMKRGAVDFLQKPVEADELLEAVAHALAQEATRRGRTRDDADLAELRARVATLTERQKAVWLGAIRGQLNKQIAADLGIVDRTVKLHRARLMERLGARSTADLVRLAHRVGLDLGLA